MAGHRQYCHNTAIVYCAYSTLYGAISFVVTVCQYCKTLPWAYTLGLGSGFSVCQMIFLFCSASNSWLDISIIPIYLIFQIAIPGPLVLVAQIRFFYAPVVLLRKAPFTTISYVRD
jgi:hypothetical protein